MLPSLMTHLMPCEYHCSAGHDCNFSLQTGTPRARVVPRAGDLLNVPPSYLRHGVTCMLHRRGRLCYTSSRVFVFARVPVSFFSLLGSSFSLFLFIYQLCIHIFSAAGAALGYDLTQYEALPRLVTW